MSDYTPITGELRDWFEHAYSYDVGETPWFGWKNTIEQMLDAIDSIHANLERENESLKAELDRARGEWDYWESTHVELPKDADGEYIHIGDVMGHRDFPNAKYTVVGIGEDSFFTRDASGGLHKHTASLYPHYQPDTWERIIEDALGSRWSAPNELSSDFTALVARCKKLVGDAE